MYLSPSPNSPLECDKSLLGEQSFDLHDFLYEFGLTLNQIFSILFGLNLKIERSEKSDQGGTNKNQELFLKNNYKLFLIVTIDMNLI